MRIDGTRNRGTGAPGARGFTLVKLMVAVAVVAILLSIAVPSYREYVRRGAVAEALEALAAGRVVAEQYYLDNRSYEGMPCPGGTQRFAFECDAEADAYTITATGQGAMDGFVYTIDQANLRTTQGPWGDANCWITRKGEGC